MKYLGTALLVLLTGPFSVGAGDNSDEKHWFSHLSSDGVSVVVFDDLGDDILLERTLKSAAEFHLREAGIPTASELYESYVGCTFALFDIKDQEHYTYTMSCSLNVSVDCTTDSWSHTISIAESKTIGIVPKTKFRSALQEVVRELIYDIANKILKYRPDATENKQQHGTPRKTPTE